MENSYTAIFGMRVIYYGCQVSTVWLEKKLKERWFHKHSILNRKKDCCYACGIFSISSL